MIILSKVRSIAFSKWLEKIDQYCNSSKMLTTTFEAPVVTIPWNKLIELLWELLEEQQKLTKEEVK